MTTGQIIFGLLFLIVIAVIIYTAYDFQKKHNKFTKLNPGDKISVRIYSYFCNCIKSATVTKKSNGKFIEAKLSDIGKCIECAEFKSKDDTGSITCWYNVTRFDKFNVI